MPGGLRCLLVPSWASADAEALPLQSLIFYFCPDVFIEASFSLIASSKKSVIVTPFSAR